MLPVATHIDERPADFNLDRFLPAAYPQIVGFVAISNKTGAGIDDLRAMIASEASRLPLMEQEWPRAWVNVEDALQQIDRPHIDNSLDSSAVCVCAASTKERGASARWVSARFGQNPLLPG